MTKRELEPIDPQALIRERLYGTRQGRLATYRDLVLGRRGIVAFTWYELLTTFVGPIPGGLGLALRTLLYPSLLASAGRGLVVGRSVTLRHPGRIRLGRRVVIDDYCLIDARGAGDDGIVLGDDVIINRGATIQAKSGGIRIGSGTNVGAGSLIVSMGGVSIGEQVGIGGGCYVSGGVFQLERGASDRDQAKFTRGPVEIGDRCWLGMRATILDGVRLGEGCIVGAGSVVNREVPPNTVAAGVPAEIKRRRDGAGGVSSTDAARAPLGS